LTVPRASGPVIKFCAPRLIFGVNEGVGSRFDLLRARTYYRRYRRRRHPFSCLTRPDSVSTVPRASSRFHVLHARTRFRRYRGRRVRFSCFARPDSISTAPRASCPVFIFFAPGLVFDGTEGVGSRFQFCAPRHVFNGTEGVGSRYQVLRARLIFGVNEGVESHFHVLRARTRFRRYRRRQQPFSCFARPDSVSTAPRASCSFFMFFAPGLVFDGTEGVESRNQVLRAPTHFRR
jgi:hypothetical protein